MRPFPEVITPCITCRGPPCGFCVSDFLWFGCEDDWTRSSSNMVYDLEMNPMMEVEQKEKQNKYHPRTQLTSRFFKVLRSCAPKNKAELSIKTARAPLIWVLGCITFNHPLIPSCLDINVHLWIGLQKKWKCGKMTCFCPTKWKR